MLWTLLVILGDHRFGVVDCRVTPMTPAELAEVIQYDPEDEDEMPPGGWGEGMTSDQLRARYNRPRQS